MATSDSRDQPIPDDANRRHRRARVLCLRKRQTHVLERQRQDKAGRVDLLGDLVAIDFVRASAEHRARHDVDEWLGVESALADHGNDFAEHLQRRRAHHVAEQLDEICVSRIGTDHKSLLPEIVEERPAALDVGRSSRRQR